MRKHVYSELAALESEKTELEGVLRDIYRSIDDYRLNRVPEFKDAEDLLDYIYDVIEAAL